MSKRKIIVEIVEAKSPSNFSQIAFAIANKILKEGLQNDGRPQVRGADERNR